MAKDFARLADDVAGGIRMLRDGAPATMKGFGAMAQGATAPGALDTKTKELMAVAIGIAVHCDGCIAFHVKMAARQGANRQEVLEAIALAIYMGGGPAAVYGADALQAYDQFAASAPSA